MQIPPPPDAVASHFFWIALPVIITTAIGQWLIWRENKRRGQAKDAEFKTLLKEYPLHEHTEWKDPESSGPLRTENIRFPKSN